ncbi:uncharacterized protein VDAG_04625 [Verticillium dahliae VdLs.17]|uniref:Uncharacterized protein n=1 Tax=Verticillium dahliae (strain VdLs.17 / ATCC MYA-4575 / FGSC 10137) TaxID=498257 RepID=G2X3N8_VERDV|nr:uncharacterized protein VDAG_04625 [Verticillium dahliae VdLs.17]EGY23187.1 hypothetical protein VDAG_04625 [Verticillium dahliae VdLs.17]KAH6689322.1 hypothetical protein EV126DRAFT_118766 [Verticillium dahliae]
MILLLIGKSFIRQRLKEARSRSYLSLPPSLCLCLSLQVSTPDTATTAKPEKQAASKHAHHSAFARALHSRMRLGSRKRRLSWHLRLWTVLNVIRLLSLMQCRPACRFHTRAPTWTSWHWNLLRRNLLRRQAPRMDGMT